MNPSRISRYQHNPPVQLHHCTRCFLTIGPCITPIWAPPAFSSKPPAIWAAKFCEEKSQGKVELVLKNLSDALQMQAMQSNAVDCSGIGPLWKKAKAWALCLVYLRVWGTRFGFQEFFFFLILNNSFTLKVTFTDNLKKKTRKLEVSICYFHYCWTFWIWQSKQVYDEGLLSWL